MMDRDMSVYTIRTNQAAVRYGKSPQTIRQLADKAHASFKVGKAVLINVAKMDAYMDGLYLAGEDTGYRRLYKRLKSTARHVSDWDDTFCKEHQARLKEAFESCLTQTEQEVISRIFGIYHEVETMPSIARGIGRSPQRVMQIRDKAIRKIRHAVSQMDKLNKFLSLDMHITIAELFQMLSLSETTLSTRAVNVLRRAGIAETAYDLLSLDEERLRKVRGCGVTTIEEILRFRECVKYMIGGEA